jgi:hypothetical protein
LSYKENFILEALYLKLIETTIYSTYASLSTFHAP